MKHYTYDGPVMMFNQIVDFRWQSGTYAVSEAKALSNFTYQYKKINGQAANSKIILSVLAIKED